MTSHKLQSTRSRRPTLVCFSHLRWNFVTQRPQHLMTRFAREYDVVYVEEPVPADDGPSWLETRGEPDGVEVLVPHLACTHARMEETQRRLLDEVLAPRLNQDSVLWYYTPMSLAFSAQLPHAQIVYDCMDELAAFRGAPPELVERERQLLDAADVVFTGGYSLYEAKRGLHPHVRPFPSSVDVAHFARGRECLPPPADIAAIPGPRLGFYGVLDERLDVGLIARIAELRPDWHLVLIGPVVKIDPRTLPQAPNIHYPGSRPYEELPAHLSSWDVALMPFALNASTRFISPTKTPEYLAGGRPVVSTPIPDVVRAYGDSGVVAIAADAPAFVACVEAFLARGDDTAAIRAEADALLAGLSWDSTWRGMRAAMRECMPPPRTPHCPLAAYDYLVVGAGFAGSVLAERLARGSDKRVLVIDRRPHVAGNAYDFVNDDGILVHKYGPHIFHTNADKVVDYLSRFSSWRPYQHRVLASVRDKLVPIPINLTTLGELYGRRFTSEEAQDFLAARAEKIPDVRTSEDVVLSTVGRELYELFFRGYTRKQWGLDPSQLDRSVTARVPTRTSADDRYFLDAFQCMPSEGYTVLIGNMLRHPNIDVATGTSFEECRHSVRYGHLIYSGPIDEFFDYRYGRLPYRSLRFEHVTLDQVLFQTTGVVNYPAEDIPYTRITEYKHLTGQRHRKTSLTYEYPSAEGDPYYPIPRPENNMLFRRYRELADGMPKTTFVGRLATYRYYNMDQVVAQALSTYERIARAHRLRPPAAESAALPQRA